MSKTLTFRDFITTCNPTLLRHEHIDNMCNVLQRVVERFNPSYDDRHGHVLRNVMFLMPPRYFKSEMVSRLLPAYFLLRYPELWVGLASYSTQQSQTYGNRARDNFVNFGGKLKDSTRAKGLWEVDAGSVLDGGMFSQGVEGSILGKGYHLGVIDDPIKPKDAHSRIFQEKFKEFWSEGWFTRREPNAANIFVMQRLCLDDPVGYLLECEKESEKQMDWHIVCYDEVKSNETLNIPSNCTLEPDWRDEGQPLSSIRFSKEDITKKHGILGDYVYNTQFQQRPSSLEGGLWKKGKFVIIDELPEGVFADGYDWDTAYTEKESNSATAYVRSCSDKKGNIYITQVDWRWVEFPDAITWFKTLNQATHFIEAKASGKSIAQTLRNEGMFAIEVPVQGGDKYARTMNALPALEAGKIHVLASVFEKLLYGERQGLGYVNKQNFTDLNDVVVQAINRHSTNQLQIF